MSSQTILVVDDDPTLRLLAELTLKRAGFGVVSAASGDGAVAEVSRSAPAAILLDFFLGEEEAPSVLQRIRAAPGGQRVPVLLVTATDDPRDLERARPFGVRAVLRKPFDPRTLALEVRAAIESSPG